MNAGAHVAFYENREVVYVDAVDVVGGRVSHVHGRERLPAYASSAGRAILAFRPEDEVDALLAHPLEKLTEHTKTNPDEIRAELCRARERGYAVIINEARLGAIGIACPIIDQTGQSVAAFGLHDLWIVDQWRIDQIAVVMTKWARHASSSIGATATPEVS